MRYGSLFLLLSASVASLALVIGGAALLLLWPALSLSLVSAAYLTRRPALLGKRPSGTLAPWALLLLGPFFLLTWATWHTARLLGREACTHEVAPGVWVGRRPFAHELPEGTQAIVDLTAEFPAAPAVRRHSGYLCVPTLDGTPPDAAALRKLLDELRGKDKVYLHCASGHGRSATVAAALLIARGIAAGVDEAEAQLRQRRPGIRLNAAQKRLLREDVLRAEA